MSRLVRLAVAVATAATAVAAIPSMPASAAGPVRLEAERATLGPTCAGQAQYTYTNAAGDGLAFLGGDGCVLTFGTGVATTAVDVRWHGGGTTAAVCGVFVARQLGAERSRTSRTCSTGSTFELATFGTGALQPGPFQLLWDPETSSHDAHVDWVQLTGDVTRTETESATPASGSCFGETHSTYTLATGETVVFHPGTNCAVSYSATDPTWVLNVRWFGGGVNGQVCGTFAIYTGIYESARTPRTCSTGGPTPDWRTTAFPINVAPAGSVFHIRWNPEISWHDAHVDWIETTAGAPGTAGTSLLPASIDFGLRADTAVSAPQNVTFTSTNAAPVYIRSVAVGPRHFGITSQGCGSARWLWQGESCTIAVRHQPEWSGDHAAWIYVDTNIGMQTMALTGQADGWPPRSDFETHDDTRLTRGTHLVEGESDDDRAGVEQARVTYRNIAGQQSTVAATLSCTTDRLYCTWTAALPALPGTYTVTAQSRDLVGHWESPGPSIRITVL